MNEPATEETIEQTIARANKLLTEAEEIARNLTTTLRGPIPVSELAQPFEMGLRGQTLSVASRLEDLLGDLRVIQRTIGHVEVNAPMALRDDGRIRRF